MTPVRKSPLWAKARLNRRARLRYHSRSVSPAVRDAVLLRDRGFCQRCGRMGRHLHHRLPRSRGGPGTEANLVLVCLACHGWIHANPEQATATGWTVSGYSMGVGPDA